MKVLPALLRCTISFYRSLCIPGYGAAVLADAVPIPSSSSFSLTRGRLWADDRISFLSSFSAYSVTFDIIDPSVPLVATLVWWDAPVSIVSPIILANDFDLTCFPPNGTHNQFSVYTGIVSTFADLVRITHSLTRIVQVMGTWH